MLAARLALALLCLPAGSGHAEDLAQAYPATLEFTRAMTPRAWRSGPDDVWALRSFELDFHGELAVRCGAANLVVGHDAGNALWAVVLPLEPGVLSCEQAGDGEAVRSVYLRLHPARIGELFPAQTVEGRGPVTASFDGRRVFGRKVGGSWQSGGQPVVPPRSSLVVDLETDGGRRFFLLDEDERTAKYEPYFERFPVPAPTPIEAERALAEFDVVWSSFDENYAGFGLLPELDWDEAGARWREAAGQARSVEQLGGALAGLLEELHDLHAWVAIGEEFLPMEREPRALNGNFRACGRLVGDLRDTKQNLAWGRTADGVGYVNVYGLSRDGLPAAFDAALEELADTWGLVVDLRFNGGGDERLGARVAGRFLSEPAVYSKHRYRSGPEHADLGPAAERVCEPRGPWRYRAPLVVLQGRFTMSSAESLALMLAQAPGAVTLGDRTAGSSGNPTQLTFGAGLRVSLPRWLDLDPEGRPVEHVGVAPDVAIEAAPGDFTDQSDPVLSAALARLREVPEDDRRPGRAE